MSGKEQVHLPRLTSNPVTVKWTLRLSGDLNGYRQVIFLNYLLLKIQKGYGNNQHHRQQAKSIPKSSTDPKTVSVTQQALHKFSEQVNILK